MPIINNPGGGLPAGVLKFKGSQDCSGNPNYPAASAGDAYIVSVAGKIGGASGTTVEAGDLYTASADNAGGTQASVGASWVVTQANVVLGTGVATALAIAVGSAGAIVVNGGALGTPSTGTLTNATGLPAAGVTGTAVTQTTLSNATLPASFTTLAASGAVTFTGGTLTGGAGNFTFTAGTGNSRTLIFQTTSSGGSAQTVLTLGADKSSTFTGNVTAGASGVSNSITVLGSGSNGVHSFIGNGSLGMRFDGGQDRFCFFGGLGDMLYLRSNGGFQPVIQLLLNTEASGNLTFTNAGTNIQLKSGTGARAGNATLVGGTVTVTNTTVTANSIIYCGRKTAGGTLGQSLSYTLSAGASFTITSVDATGVLSALDTSVVSFIIVELN